LQRRQRSHQSGSDGNLRRLDNDCDGLTDVADPDLMSSPLEMSCPATQTLNLSSTCSAILPDYRSLVNISAVAEP
jgi:hypothetical protein